VLDGLLWRTLRTGASEGNDGRRHNSDRSLLFLRLYQCIAGESQAHRKPKYVREPMFHLRKLRLGVREALGERTLQG
jgi:hypothetical protein